MKDQILELLLSSDDFLSGEAISNRVGISRTAVWKYIQKLKQEGYRIESITNKGYRIIENPEGFVAEELKYMLKGCSLIDDILVFDSIDSTNQEAKRRANELNTALLIAEEQTQGKGRRGRQWISEHGTGIFMSLLLRPKISPVYASCLTLLAGLATQRAINTITGLDVKIKWPNDLVINGKKVCGILTEMSAEMEQIHYVVIGIGMNVNYTSISTEIKDIASSLSVEGEKTYSRKQLVQETIKQFESLYEGFLTNQSLNYVVEDYNSVCVNVGKDVKVDMKDGALVGKALGINESGSLLIDVDGKIEEISSGEVSVRGLYGYV